MSQPPLVAHIIYALGTGGLENGLINIINRAPADRYRHAIICLTGADDFASRIIVPGVEVIELHKQPGQDFGVYRRLWKVLRRLRPALVHTRNLASLEMQLVTLPIAGLKRVHGEHGRDIQDLDGTNKKYNLLRKALKPFIHRYIAVSKDLQSWLKHTINVPDHKLRQIYNGVDTKKFKPCQLILENSCLPSSSFLSPKTVVVGTVGRLAEVKNQGMLIEAFNHLLTATPQLRETLRLILVGDGPLFQSLSDRVRDMGLSELVWMTGDREDIPELLQLMDIFVLPSLAEGISNTVLEAMATGLPVVATRVGGNPELIMENHNGRLVSVNHAAELAGVIAQLLADDELRQSMGRRGLELVRETFNWDRAVAEYLSVYDEVLGIRQHETTDNRVQGN